MILSVRVTDLCMGIRANGTCLKGVSFLYRVSRCLADDT